MLTIKDIPQTWKVALAHIQKINPEAVIGGGSLRDLDNGRPIKDVDIFVKGRGVDDMDALRDALVDSGIECGEIDPDKLYPIGDGNDVIGFFEVAFPGVTRPLQIIVVDHSCEVQKIVERFDYGICRIAFDGRNLFASQDYLDDKDAKVFRLRLDLDVHNPRLPQVVHRYARLVRKYEGWTWAPFIPAGEELC